MLPYVVKKKEDLRITIDYLEGEMTGNEAIAMFNNEVKVGRRKGKTREVSLPFTRQEGLRLSQLENARKARAAYSVSVCPSLQEQIRKGHTKGKLSYVRLSRKYGYSASVTRRILGAR